MCDFDRPEFYCDPLTRARKPHRCYECRRSIEPGEKYIRVSGKWDGDVRSYAYCVACYRVIDLLNGVHCGPTMGDLADWLSGGYENDVDWRAILAPSTEALHYALGLVYGRALELDDGMETRPARRKK